MNYYPHKLLTILKY